MLFIFVIKKNDKSSNHLDTSQKTNSNAFQQLKKKTKKKTQHDLIVKKTGEKTTTKKKINKQI